MTAISVTKARENIYQILSDVNNSSQPITITNNRGKNGVLVSEDDWNAIQETNVILKFYTGYGRKHYRGRKRAFRRLLHI